MPLRDLYYYTLHVPFHRYFSFFRSFKFSPLKYRMLWSSISRKLDCMKQTDNRTLLSECSVSLFVPIFFVTSGYIATLLSFIFFFIFPYYLEYLHEKAKTNCIMLRGSLGGRDFFTHHQAGVPIPYIRLSKLLRGTGSKWP